MRIVIHYSEIGTKGKNRDFFERKLAENIRLLLLEARSVKRHYGKIIVSLSAKYDPGVIKERLTIFPGVASFALARKAGLDISKIQNTILEVANKIKFTKFRITTRRSNKNFPLDSQKLNILLGDLVRKKLGKKVDLENPEAIFYVEVGEKEAYIYTEKFLGIGGLPVGSSGKAIVSLSGGIDSPVAAYMAMKRGLEVICVHIFNETLDKREAASKIDKIVKELSKIQGKSKLYIAPFREIQKAIISYIPSEYRMIIYRRFMMKIVEKIAQTEGAKAIITGDSLGQVASQTVENLGCIYEAASLPILPPLIGMNKEEIISLAKKINTYEYSIIPYPDCCSFMIAKHPETRGNLQGVVKLENLIENRERLVDGCVEGSVPKVI